MGLGLIIDDLCVFIGVGVLWAARGCRYSLWQELKKVEAGDFWRRKDGVIGLVFTASIVAAGWLILRLV
jgi:hypothetical protein